MRGLQDNVKRRQLFHYFHMNKDDIVLLQETHSIKSNVRHWKSEWGGQIFCSHGSNKAKGVAILFKKGLDVKKFNVQYDEEGRYIILDMLLNDIRITLVNCYAPNLDMPKYFLNLFEKINAIGNMEIIFGGDFNTILSEQDKSVGYCLHLKSTKILHEFMEVTELVDIWRLHHPDKFEFTWKQTKPRLMMERIDFFLVNTALVNKIVKTEIQPGYKSDHSFPAMVYLDTWEKSKGSGYWKLSQSFLEDKDFTNEIRAIIKGMTEEYPDIVLRWEMIKMKTRGFVVQFGSQCKRSNKNKLTLLNKKLQLLEQQQASAPSNIRLFNDHQKQALLVKEEIEKLVAYKTQGAQLRCKVN